MKIELSKAIIEIEKEAFYGCENLEKVIIPENACNIGSGAFTGCTNLKKVDI